MRARTANPRLRTVIKGDQNAPYGQIQDVMDVLQQVRITRFNLVTDLEKS
jgi:biopolymer transport protein ExbD